MKISGSSFEVYSVIIGSDPEWSSLYVIVVLFPELFCLGSWGGDIRIIFCGILCFRWVEAGAVAFVRYHIFGAGTVVIGYQDVELRFPRWFGDPDFGFLWRGLKFIVCGGGDVPSYVNIGVTLDQVIAARRSLRIIFTLILVYCVLTVFRYIVYLIFLIDWKSNTHDVVTCHLIL